MATTGGGQFSGTFELAVPGATVPLPAGALLFLGGGAILAGARRRAA